jgi:hypothetical protein
LLCLAGTRICLLFQMVRRQIADLVPVTHAGPHFGEYKLPSNQSRASDCGGLDTTCICWMWPQRVQRSVQCSCPGREGVMRCTMVAPQQRSHRELDRTRVVRGLLQRTFLIFREICQSLVRGSKLAAKPPSRVAAHGIADHQGSLETITLGARESAEFVPARTGRNTGQARAGLAVLTARALYGSKRRTPGS